MACYFENLFQAYLKIFRSEPKQIVSFDKTVKILALENRVKNSSHCQLV